tara:strand:- start:484 stop:771 length:288 start_codon:yes stop_codon:yes gene_type:complete
MLKWLLGNQKEEEERIKQEAIKQYNLNNLDHVVGQTVCYIEIFPDGSNRDEEYITNLKEEIIDLMSSLGLTFYIYADRVYILNINNQLTFRGLVE